ncbi:MAG: hypothetical protein GXY48_15350 [Methanomicrobiales archaeon]|nr:hypothetical protein [Methanomicrobiales archaeon]
MKTTFPLIFIALLFLCGLSQAAWSIPDPNNPSKPASGAYLDSILSQGYWQFEYDPTNPVSAAMYCCWWEMIYGNQKKYYDALSGYSSDSSSSGSSSSIETKSYCPACHFDDEFATLEVEPELKELSDELMETKPWLKEGKNNIKTESTTANNTTPASVMTFSEPVKIE